MFFCNSLCNNYLKNRMFRLGRNNYISIFLILQKRFTKEHLSLSISKKKQQTLETLEYISVQVILLRI